MTVPDDPDPLDLVEESGEVTDPTSLTRRRRDQRAEEALSAPRAQTAQAAEAEDTVLTRRRSPVTAVTDDTGDAEDTEDTARSRRRSSNSAEQDEGTLSRHQADVAEVADTIIAQRSLPPLHETQLSERSRAGTVAAELVPDSAEDATESGAGATEPDPVPGDSEPRMTDTVPEYVTARQAARQAAKQTAIADAVAEPHSLTHDLSQDPLPEVPRNRERRRAITVISVACVVVIGSAAGLVILLLWP